MPLFSKKKTILIVEDEISLAHALRDKLSRAGYRILVEHNGDDGLRTALKKHPHLILLDLIMPFKDGVTFLRELRDTRWGKSAEVIVLTNLGLDEEGKNTVEHDVRDYIVKAEFKIEDVVTKVNEVLGEAN